MADEDDFATQLFCPVCCSTMDVDKPGHHSLVCVSCGTSFEVDVDPEIVAEHSLVG